MGKERKMEFLMGADVSSLQAMEEAGAKYYDFDGREAGALELLKKYGVNCIRLRIWNEPVTSFDRGDYCDLAHTAAMAKRVRQAGMKLFLDFHYSDTWADWKNQRVPRGWEELDLSELGEQVFVYTREALTALDGEDAYPDVVQIGNEIGCGFLWEHGRAENPENFAFLLNQGIAAVRSCDGSSRHTEIMLHVEHGADRARTEGFFDLLKRLGVTDFDLIGLSYYPYWAGPYEDFTANLQNLARKFTQPVVVTETAFPYTDVSHDRTPNVVTEEVTLKSMGLKATRENQRKVLEEVIRLVRREKNGGGVFYWEPVWYCVPGVGVVRGAGNEWENQALFDEKGRALEALKAFGG